MYIKSRFNMLSLVDENTYILLNTVSGAILKLPKDIYENLEECSDKDLFDVCKKNGILVDSEFDELSYVNYLRYHNLTSDKSVHSFVILPTTACNAKCFYCYEEGIEFSTMTPQTASRTAEYIISSSKGQDIKLQWFGGEPLVAENVIDLISEHIVKCLDEGQNLNASMITNASLIDETILHKMIYKWKIKRVQITLDGLENEYTKRKGFNNTNVFYKVLESIKQLLSHNIQVAIRLNFDRLNFEEILKLIPYLSKTFAQKNNLNVYAIPLFANKNSTDFNRYFEKEELDRYFRLIYESLFDNGFIKSDKYFAINLKSHFCGVANMNHAVILPNGDIYKCQHVNIDGNNPIGNVFRGVRFSYEHTKWLNPELPTKCFVCECLPLCQGGCKAGIYDDSIYDCCLLKYTQNSALNILNKLKGGI